MVRLGEVVVERGKLISALVATAATGTVAAIAGAVRRPKLKLSLLKLQLADARRSCKPGSTL